MADGSSIEWTDATWQPITGCSVVSPGCTNCYAMRLAGTRLQHHPSRAGLTRDTKAGPVWTGEVRLNEQWLDQPFRWKRSRRIFVCAHGDLFAEGVPDEWIDRVFAVMALAPQHTFQVLTKRAERMRDFLCAPDRDRAVEAAVLRWHDEQEAADYRLSNRLSDHPLKVAARLRMRGDKSIYRWPLPNVWLGVSVEDQRRADERIPHLLATPAAVRFLSCEPLLSAVDLREWLCVPGTDFRLQPELAIGWVIAGGESGRNARGGLRQWARSLRDQCGAAGVPFFWKQNGEWIDADEWLDGLTSTITLDGKPWHPARPLNFTDAATLAKLSGDRRYEHHSDGTTLIRVGKKAAGRLLDGRAWDEMP